MIFTLFLSLTVATLVMTVPGETIDMIDTNGHDHPITHYIVFKTLAIGWAAFILSLIFNILYYALHPSEVEMWNFKKKLVVTMLGKPIDLVAPLNGMDLKHNHILKIK